jgi:hypothetical protein
MKPNHFASERSALRTRTGVTLLIATGFTVLLGVLGGGTAGARTNAVGPNQHFVGLVKGKSANAVIAMACTFPLSSGEKGHPLSGQDVTVSLPATTSTSVGYTGSKGHAVTARFISSSAANTSTLTFTKYGSQAIPTTFTLPCSGSGTVVFSPAPTSKTAQSVTVSVSYGNVTVSPPD